MRYMTDAEREEFWARRDEARAALDRERAAAPPAEKIRVTEQLRADATLIRAGKTVASGGDPLYNIASKSEEARMAEAGTGEKVEESVCYMCLHFYGQNSKGRLYCKAFPDGIPSRFAVGTELHDKVVEQQEFPVVFTPPETSEE